MLDLSPVSALVVLQLIAGAFAGGAAVTLLGTLRSSGLAAIAAARPRSPKAQLRDANAAGARFACILGDDELAAGAAAVKDLRADGGAQQLVPLDGVVEYITRGGGEAGGAR
ncbi:MAG: hypothetical protein NVSMB65_16280 [Chloroflexota bacterium]